MTKQQSDHMELILPILIVSQAKNKSKNDINYKIRQKSDKSWTKKDYQ